MLTHVCRETGWTVEYVLSMPARRFYAMRLEMLRQDQKEKANFLYDLCDVSAISIADSKYFEEAKTYFRQSMMDPEDRLREDRMRRHIFDADDEIDSRRGAMAMKAMLGGGVRMNG